MLAKRAECRAVELLSRLPEELGVESWDFISFQQMKEYLCEKNGLPSNPRLFKSWLSKLVHSDESLIVTPFGRKAHASNTIAEPSSPTPIRIHPSRALPIALS